MSFSNFIHLNSMPLEYDELQQVDHLNLKYFDPDGEYWDWREDDNNSSMDIDLINEDVSFITNISFCTKQIEEIQILFVEKYNGDSNFTAIKKFFEIPANEVLSFQNVMILGIHHNNIAHPNQDYHSISIDMTVSNAAIEEEGRKRGKTPVWETLFGIVLPFIPDISSLDPFIPDQPDIPDYSGLIGGISELVQNNIPGVIPINNLLEVAPQELEGICDSYLEYGNNIQSEDEYPTDDATQGYNQGEWDKINQGEWDDKNGLNNGGV